MIEAFIKELEGFLDALDKIRVSRCTVIRRDAMIRKEMESIPDLSILDIVEGTCSNEIWSLPQDHKANIWQMLAASVKKKVLLW